MNVQVLDVGGCGQRTAADANTKLCGRCGHPLSVDMARFLSDEQQIRQQVESRVSRCVLLAGPLLILSGLVPAFLLRFHLPAPYYWGTFLALGLPGVFLMVLPARQRDWYWRLLARKEFAYVREHSDDVRITRD